MKPARFLIVAPTFLDWDLGTYVRNLLNRRGIECSTFAYWPLGSRREASRQLLKEVERFRPQVLIGLKLDRILPEALRAIRRKGVFSLLWYVDCEGPKPPGWIRPLVRESDVFLTSAKGMVPQYQALSAKPVYWIYEGVYLPGFPLWRPGALEAPEVYRSDVAFVGNIYYPATDKRLAHARQDLLKRIQQVCDLKVWGPQGDPRASRKWGADYPAIEWPAYHEELVKVCHGAKIILGTGRGVEGVELYFSNRTFLTLAAGGFHLTRYMPGLETMFASQEHLVWFHSEDECLDLVRYYLARPSLRRRIAAEGQRWVRRRYSMARQVGRILKIIGRHYDER